MVEEAKYSRKDVMQVQRLIAELTALRDPAHTILRLLPYGRLAARELRDRLINGRPSGVYQPRQQIIFALAELGARSVLLEYLQKPQDIKDPVTRFGEEAVQSSAARELSRWKNNETFRFLLAFARQDRRTGALESLAEFERPEAIPVFISAIGDDFYRPAAEEGLRRLGDTARPHLIRAAVEPTYYRGGEPPWSVSRRASALSLLKNIRLGEDDWRALHVLLKDPHPEIAAAIGALAADIAETKDHLISARQILRAYPFAIGNWRVRTALEESLMHLQPEAAGIIHRALQKGTFKINRTMTERLTYLDAKMKRA